MISCDVQYVLDEQKFICKKETGWYMDEQTFFDIQKESLQEYPKDKNNIYEIPDLPIEDYQVMNYKVEVNSYDNMAIVQEEIQTNDAKINAKNKIHDQEEMIQFFKDTQVNMRRIFAPIVLVVFVALSFYLSAFYCFQKYSYEYAFQNNRIDQKWKVHHLFKILITCVILCSLMMGLIYGVSQQNFINVFTMRISNSNVFANVDLFNSVFYTTFINFFQVLSMLETSSFAVIVTLLLSCIVDILRYLPTCYFYYRARKLF